MKRIKTLLLVIFLVPISLFSVKYPVIIYQTSDGLPQSIISSLAQDHKGYIYIGTQSGIGKFDGTSFQVITHKNGLPNNLVNYLEKDNHGNIWVATLEGLGKIDVHNDGRISTYLKSKTILSLTNEPDANTLWIITKNSVYYYKNGEFVNYNIFQTNNSDDEEKNIKGLSIAPIGIKYFYSENQIIKVIDNKIVQTIQTKEKINFIKQLNSKTVVGTQNGIFYLENNKLIIFLPVPQSNSYITAAVTDEKGRAWIGTREGILVYYNISNPTDYILLDDKNGLSSRRINTLLMDREKNILLGTDWGVAQFSTNLFRMYDETDGIPYRFVWSFAEIGEMIYMACDNGVVKLNPKTGIITPISTINNQLKHVSIRNILQIKNNQYLLGSKDRGVFLWIPEENDKLIHIHKKSHILSCIKIDEKNVWYGTDDGLLKYTNGQFVWYKEGLKDLNIWALGAIDKDTLLIGSGKGVQTFNKEKYIPSELEQIIGENTVINDIKVISPNEIYIAAELEGLFIYKNRQMKRLTTKNGILHNDIWSVTKDNNDNIWFSTSVSLERYSRDGFISHFSKKTGLFGDEGSIHSSLKARNGRIYFGITPGVIEIPLQDIETTFNKPILQILEIKANNQIITKKSVYRLGYYQNNVEFNYKAVSTRKENPILYRTRLTPFDSKFSESTQETHIKYLNLIPDEYVFEVIANNGGGEKEWFSSINKIRFTIISPFWKKWWFILIVITLSVLVILLFIRIRINALERQKKHLEELVKKRTEELKEKNKELQYLSVTDPLTDLKNRRYLEEKIKEDINLIERYIYDKSKLPEKEELHYKIPILGVFILDIDFFKKVNDEYGHKAGDIVIIDIARLLLEMLRHSDTIVRWGGEEFLIITRQYERDTSFELAERIRKKIESFTFKIDEDIIINKTISVGFAHFPFLPNETRQANWPHVVSLADSALYIAKNNGRNLSVGIEIGDNPLDIDFKEIVSNIKLGIEKKYLKLICNKENLTILQHKT